MNKKGNIVFWLTTLIGFLAIILLLNGFDKEATTCLIVEVLILNISMNKGINFKRKE